MSTRYRRTPSPVAAAAIGTAVHRLGLFIHEGAHFNLAPGKAASDRLANATVGLVVLTDVRAYRPIHMAHHRKLGRWLQLGGHADGDGDLGQVALREAEEESGLAGLSLIPQIFPST